MLAFFQCAKMQISCLLILLFLSHNLFCEEKRLGKITIYHILHHVAVVAALFFYGCLVLLLVFSRYVEKRKRLALISCLGFAAVMTVVQGFFPELLGTSLSVVIAVVGVYIHLENPAIKNLEKYHNEMVMGFATLVENRDAMPLDKCFEIIEQGSGTDFDPEIVKVFIEARPKVEEIYNRLK